MSKRKKKPSKASDLKVGVLFNLPAEPLRGEKIDYLAEAEAAEQAEAVQEALKKLGFNCQLFPLKDDIEPLIAELRMNRPDVVVNLCEGAFGDSHQEMNAPSLLELLGIPYTGSSPLCLGLCQNKGLTKDILKANGISTPRYQVLESLNDWSGELKCPLFVKPLREDASIGISSKSYVRNDAELETQVEYIRAQYKQAALVEEYIAGRELNVSILGNEKPEVLPISEIIFEWQEEPKIVDYAAKWLKESEEFKKTKPKCPTDVTESIKAKVEDIALMAYEALCCRDYARVDMRLRHEEPFVLEVNPNPDISHEAGFARSLRAAGIPYEEFVRRIVSFALGRGTQKQT